MPQSRDANKKFEQWLQSNGHISKQQWNSLVQKGIIFSVLGAAGQSYKKPSELEIYQAKDLQANGGTIDAKRMMHEAEIDIEQLVQLSGGNQKPVLTKTTTPVAVVWDQTVTPPTVTQVKDMAADPGALTII